MQFTTHVDTLLDSLSIVTRALASRAARPILEGVLIQADGDSVTLTCSDGRMSMESTVPAEVKKPGQTVVPGRLLNDLIRRLPGGEVSLRLADAGRLQVTCLSSRSSIAAQSAAEYPDMPVIRKRMELTMPQKELRRMIGGAVFAIATDESRQLLTGCLMEMTANEVRVVALDGFRLAMQTCEQKNELPAGTEKYRAVVPGRMMNEIARVLPDSEDPCTLAFDGSHVILTFGSVKVSSVLLQGEFIDYERIIPATFATETMADKGMVTEAIDRASLMAREGRNNLVKFHVTEDAIAITSNAEMGEIHEELTCATVGQPIDIAFNAKYLSDALRNMEDDQVCFCFNSPVSPSVIRPKDSKKSVYLVLPVRTF